MRSATIPPRSTIQQQQRLAYSFNNFTNTSFDAQNIVLEYLYQIQKLTMAHLPTFSPIVKVRKGSGP
jgi:hypothetical protein